MESRKNPPLDMSRLLSVLKDLTLRTSKRQIPKNMFNGRGWSKNTSNGFFQNIKGSTIISFIYKDNRITTQM